MADIFNYEQTHEEIQELLDWLKYKKEHGGDPGSEVVAADVIYDNITSGLTATNAQAAIDEVSTKTTSALSAAQTAQGAAEAATSAVAIVISDVEALDIRVETAEDSISTLSTTTSQLATTVSGLSSDKEDKSNKVTSITSSSTNTQYPSAKAVYNAIQGASPSSIAASHVTYDKSGTQLIATNAQAAITEIEGIVRNINSDLIIDEARLNSHIGNTSNPHEVSASQVGAYTTAQIDDTLESLSGHGTTLASTADVDNIKTIGRYRAASTATATSISNLPVPVPGALIVLPTSSADNSRLMQLYIPNWATTNQIGILYIRQLLSGGWGDWYKLGDTTPTAIGSTSSGALNITDLNDLPKRDAEYYTLTGTETARITNKPSEITDGSIRVEVKFITGGAAQERCVQTLYVPNGDYFYQRAYGSNGWGSWYKFSGTVVS